MGFAFQISKNGLSLALDRSVGERAMIVKNAYGDFGILYGHWADFKKGVPGE